MDNLQRERERERERENKGERESKGEKEIKGEGETEIVRKGGREGGRERDGEALREMKKGTERFLEVRYLLTSVIIIPDCNNFIQHYIKHQKVVEQPQNI